MEQAISSLDLPEFQIKRLSKLGYNYNYDIKFDETNELRRQGIITKGDWERVTKVPVTKTALDICQEEHESQYIRTFCKSLDKVFGLGIPVKHISEFCGGPGSGKTQVCLQLCINIQFPICCGGLQSKCIYISTNNGLMPNRLKEMAESTLNRMKLFHSKHTNNVDPMLFSIENILNGVHFCRVADYIELIAIVKSLRTGVKKKNIRLIIIDSICAPLKYIVENKERLSVLNTLLTELQILSDSYNLAVILTNDLTTRIRMSETVPSLGDCYFHRLNQRFLFSRVFNNKFKVATLKSIRRGDSNCVFAISDSIRDL